MNKANEVAEMVASKMVKANGNTVTVIVRGDYLARPGEVAEELAARVGDAAKAIGAKLVWGKWAAAEVGGAGARSGEVHAISATIH